VAHHYDLETKCVSFQWKSPDNKSVCIKKQQTASQEFCLQVLENFELHIQQQNMWLEKYILHQDNAPSHTIHGMGWDWIGFCNTVHGMGSKV
jgi:hypothetical protein